MQIVILGSGGGAPSGKRETACTLVRDGDRALLLDAGTGVRRLVAAPGDLAGLSQLDILLTHFHLDHVCGLSYLPWLGVGATIWAPGRWLYERDSADILTPLRTPPLAPTDVRATYRVNELAAGEQRIGTFTVRASAQPRHWAPSAGLRVGDQLAVITDTPYEPASAELAAGVDHLLHEAWSTSRAPRSPDRDATAADAGRVAREAGVGALTLIHVNPTLADDAALVADAAAEYRPVTLGEDELVLTA